ncbi:DUF1523 family protein [Paracoccus sp. (in: a-proteobacteria)]|uniref:DUF1523 family protein n=1 Tax=Paracoccus sp. TaxID=267 RepID=UPI00321F6459
MRWLPIALGTVFAVMVYMFLDYALPARQTVRITNTYNRLTEIGANSIFYASPDTGTVQNAKGQRDVRFIDTVRPNGRPLVYRNEDTGWIWPPFFKYDSSNLHARATDLKSTAEKPQWVSVTSYGWRIAWLSVYPNAVAIRPVAGPDVRPFNWAAQIVLLLIGGFLFLIWRMWNQFRERTIDPALRSADAMRDEMVADVAQTQGRLRRWWRGLRGK